MKGNSMRGLGQFQIGQMKQRDARIFALCQHLRSAVDILEQIASQPYQPPHAAAASASAPPATSSRPLDADSGIPPSKIAYTIKEATAAIGLSRSTIYKLMASGELQTIRIGQRRLIRAEALNRLLTGSEQVSS
jgi:excisionase family DNA binding protein